MNTPTVPDLPPDSPQRATLPASLLPPVLWLEDLHRAAQQERSWIWYGYLAAGSVTLLTSQWKSGKTTLVSILLARMKEGGVLAGQAVAAGKAVVVSEEGPEVWEERSRTLGFGAHLGWLCRPFRGKPTPAQWLALLDCLAGLRVQHGITLAVIDPLAAFLPGRDEGNAALMLEALAPLQQLTSAGMAVLLLHHPRKKGSVAGMSARGSGALPGFVDILVEMDWYSRTGAPDDHRRRLRAWSRYKGTPRSVVVELNAEGTDYRTLGDFQEEEFARSWQRLKMVLEDAKSKLTRRQILDEWPPDFDRPERTTLWRWLQRAVSNGWVCQEGTGRKQDPFRYWLPGQEAKWPPRTPLPELPSLEERLLEALCPSEGRGKRGEAER